MGQRFRVHPYEKDKQQHAKEPYTFKAYDLSELPDLWLQVPTDTPEQPHVPEGEWYCQNENCDVREVTVRCKYIDRRPPTTPPTMKCPQCGKVLKFHHYVQIVGLEPVR